MLQSKTYPGLDPAAGREKLKDLNKFIEFDAPKGSQTTIADSYQAAITLAQMGMKPSEIKKVLPTVLEAALAQGISPDEAAVSIGTAWLMEGKKLSPRKLSDTMLTATTKSPISNQTELGFGLKYAHPIFRAKGESFEDLITSAMLLAKSGIRGESMGTGLRGFGAKFLKDTQDFKEFREYLGVEAKYQSGARKGSYKPIFEFLSEVNKAFKSKGIGDEEAGTMLARWLDTDQLTTGLVLLDAVRKNPLSKLRSISKMTGVKSDGITSRMKQIQLGAAKSFEADAKMRSSGEQALSVTGKVLAPTANAAMNKVTAGLDYYTNFMKSFTEGVTERRNEQLRKLNVLDPSQSFYGPEAKHKIFGPAFGKFFMTEEQGNKTIELLKELNRKKLVQSISVNVNYQGEDPEKLADEIMRKALEPTQNADSLED